MDVKQISEVFQAGKYVFPTYFSKLSANDLKGLCETWATFFADTDSVVFAKAFHACAYTNTFFPSIAEVQQQIVTLTQPEQLTEQEAWSLVRKALTMSNWTENGISMQRGWDSLPPEVQRVVGSKTVLRDWALTDTDQVNTVIASNFMRSYRVIAAREEKYRALPSPIRDQIKALAGSKSVVALESGQS